MTGGDLSDDETQIAAVCRSLKTIAVIGAHHEVSRPAHDVPAYLHQRGVAVCPVNPRFAGQTLFGEQVSKSLAELSRGEGRRIDLVNVFRASHAVGEHVDDILSMTPLPAIVWLQLGIRDDQSAQVLQQAGLHVVQDRCLLVDYRRFV